MPLYCYLAPYLLSTLSKGDLFYSVFDATLEYTFLFCPQKVYKRLLLFFIPYVRRNK